MMQLPVFQVDALTDKVFGGNPAAVCPLGHWLPDDVLQKIAQENSVAATAFVIPLDDGFEIRWFTPEKEVLQYRSVRPTNSGLTTMCSPSSGMILIQKAGSDRKGDLGPAHGG
jgi:hypothetical protein